MEDILRLATEVAGIDQSGPLSVGDSSCSLISESRDSGLCTSPILTSADFFNEHITDSGYGSPLSVSSDVAQNLQTYLLKG